jgi:hypothetical protein
MNMAIAPFHADATIASPIYGRIRCVRHRTVTATEKRSQYALGQKWQALETMEKPFLYSLYGTGSARNRKE